MDTIKFKREEIGHSMIAMTIFIIALNFLFYFLKVGNSPLTLTPFIILNVIMLITLLLFYKIKVTISERHLKMSLGIGIIHKTIALEDVNFEKLEIIKPSILTGIGIRYTGRGVLYNVNFGTALLINNKFKGKSFLIGIRSAKEIEAYLKTL